MDSRERVIRTLEFRNPDRLARDLWMLPAARMEYKEELDRLVEESDLDIVSFVGPFDHGFTPEYYQRGGIYGSLGERMEQHSAGSDRRSKKTGVCGV